jgi:hypothetical protein
MGVGFGGGQDPTPPPLPAHGPACMPGRLRGCTAVLCFPPQRPLKGRVSMAAYLTIWFSSPLR